MLKEQIIKRGIKDSLVLSSMTKVKRHLFVPQSSRRLAYEDHPLPIGYGQTISQPYIVAYMTELLGLKGGEKVLEIGTGSGYQAAVLANIADTVYSIEIICELEKAASEILKANNYNNVFTKCGNGYHGWKEQGPYYAIIITASPPSIPRPLINQLKMGGILISPQGKVHQQIIRITKTESGIKEEELIDVRFVPMTGENQSPP